MDNLETQQPELGSYLKKEQNTCFVNESWNKHQLLLNIISWLDVIYDPSNGCAKEVCHAILLNNHNTLEERQHKRRWTMRTRKQPMLSNS